MKKVLYVFPIKTSFVTSDQQLLSKHYEVKPFSFVATRKIYTPFVFIRQFFFLISHLPSTSFVVSQFSGYHSFLPSLLCRFFRCKHYIILHGTECNNFPEYAYGYKIRPLLFWFSKQSLALASLIIPVSDSLVDQEYTFKETKFKKQGLRSFYPDLKTPVRVIHNGISEERFNILPNVTRIEKSFVTVAAGLSDKNRRKIKGLDLVCDLALRFPDSVFTFIGGKLSADLDLPNNVQVIPHVPNEELQFVFNKHTFYLQLSVSEGFGISVVEAMLCGCIPIVSDVGILPKIAGPVGFVLKRKDIDVLTALVHKAFELEHISIASDIRKYAAEKYSLRKREQMLISIFNSSV